MAGAAEGIRERRDAERITALHCRLDSRTSTTHVRATVQSRQRSKIARDRGSVPGLPERRHDGLWSRCEGGTRAMRRQGVRHSTNPTHEASTRSDHPATRALSTPEHPQPFPLTIGTLRLLRWQVSLIKQQHRSGERGSGRSAAARRRPSPGCMPQPRGAAARV